MKKIFFVEPVVGEFLSTLERLYGNDVRSITAIKRVHWRRRSQSALILTDKSKTLTSSVLSLFMVWVPLLFCYPIETRKSRNKFEYIVF